MLTEDGYRLRILIGEADKHQGKPLYEWLVNQAREKGLAGATVLRGIAGYGAHSQIHTAKILDVSTNLPLVIEIVDQFDKVEAFLEVVDSAILEGLATVEKVHMRLYRQRQGT